MILIFNDNHSSVITCRRSGRPAWMIWRRRRWRDTRGRSRLPLGARPRSYSLYIYIYIQYIYIYIYIYLFIIIIIIIIPCYCIQGVSLLETLQAPHHVYASIQLDVCMYVYIYIYIDVCIYIHLYIIYIHMCVYIYINTHINILNTAPHRRPGAPPGSWRVSPARRRPSWARTAA